MFLGVFCLVGVRMMNALANKVRRNWCYLFLLPPFANAIGPTPSLSQWRTEITAAQRNVIRRAAQFAFLLV